MRRAIAGSLAAAAALLALAAPAAQGAFGLNEFDVFFAREEGSPIAATAAGSHPYSMSTSFGVNYTGEGEAAALEGEIKDATFTLPAGFVGNPLATPRCSTAAFLAENEAKCPADTRVGENAAELEVLGTIETDPVFNLNPPPGSAARLGFRAAGAVPVVIDVGVKPEAPFNVIATLRNTRQVVKVFSASMTLFGTPLPGGTPFLTLPGSCTGPLASSYEALSWQGGSDSGSALTHDAAGNPQGFAQCEKPPFGPVVSAQPSSESAASASGLSFELSFDQAGLLSSNPGARAQSTVKEAEITLPEGMTANPSLAEGLEVCDPGQLAAETLASGGCPGGSKIGSIEVSTPLLEEQLPGSVYIAEPDDPATSAPGAENPFDSLIAFYMVIKEPQRGVLVKLPAKVEPDPETGRLVTTVANAPQIPFERFSFHFREGQRAPLITPPTCGTYTTEARLTPWARPGQSVLRKASFQIATGPGGGPCPPAGAPPFEPGFEAGSLSNAAATYSPFAMRITRRDGDQDLTRFDATLPPGMLAKLAGVGKCPEAAIALAKARSGRAELAAPSCPPASQIGTVLGGAGVGGALTYVPGKVYLAGPTHGAPLSVVGIVPAVAGPFDVGTIVVRQALALDPRTGEVRVDGAASDPIPHILRGIPLAVRDVRVSVDRPQFTLNPTNCDPMATLAAIWGGGADPFSLLDDSPAPRAARFQAADCGSLGFEPRVGIKLRGGTRRGAHPALRAVVTPRPGQANFSRAVVTLPRSAFLDQAHIRTICTRVQFAPGAGNGAECPPGAVYGRATAWSPLLDEPLSGPVFLRSSSNNLPDLVVALHGLVDIELASRIDSVRGGIRSTFEDIPDAPVSRFVLEMQGGKKGLIVNSRNLCFKPRRNRAISNIRGQNGRLSKTKPRVIATKCQQRRKAKRKRAKRSTGHVARASRAG